MRRRKAHPLQLKRLSQDLANTLRHLDGRSRVDRRGEHEAKLVTTEACDGPAGSDGIGQPRAQLAQHVVADVVAEAVVDLLESVEIDHEHCGRFRGPKFEGCGEALEEKTAVGEAGQLVGARLAPAVRERTQLPKRICGPGDGDHERCRGENDAKVD